MSARLRTVTGGAITSSVQLECHDAKGSLPSLRILGFLSLDSIANGAPASQHHDNMTVCNRRPGNRNHRTDSGT
jgi:hypothetical protein